MEVTHLPSCLRCHRRRDAMFSFVVELPEVTGLIEFVPAEVIRIHYKSHRLKRAHQTILAAGNVQ